METINNTKIPPNSIPEANTSINSNKEKPSPVVCNGNENFPCPSSSYNSAIAELEKAEQELILAKTNLQLARKSVFLFLNTSPIPILHPSDGDKRSDVEDCDRGAENRPEAKDSDEFVIEKSRDCDKSSVGEESVSCRDKNADEDADENCVAEGDDSDGHGGGEGSNLEIEESKYKNVEKENVDEDENENKSMDDSRESSVSDDSDDSVNDFDGDLALLSQMFGGSQSREIDNDREEFQCVKEDEVDRETEVEVRSEISNSGHRSASAEKDDPFTNFRYYTPAVKKRKLARHVTFSPIITVFPDGAARNDNEASRSEPARQSENNLQSPCAVKDDLFAEFRYDKSNLRSRRNVTSPELSMITEETARYYNEAKRYKMAKRSANPAIPDSKRKRLYWTHEEEEKLVDCVRIFLNKGCRKMSWKSILDYGSRVFNRSRTPEDLRYKWKSMVKQASRVERS